MSRRFTRLDGESMPQFQARIAAIQAAERVVYAPPAKPRRKRAVHAARAEDCVDKLDDLGESHD